MKKASLLLGLLLLVATPVFAETPAAAPAPSAKATVSTDDKREGKMRDRWRKMTPEQREEMRKKAERRLQERYERLSQTEQGSVNTIMAEMEKLSKDQRSVLMARIRQKAHKDRLQRKVMKEMEKKATPAVVIPAVAPPTVATPTAPVAPTAPTAPAPAAH
jgi:hypothetical protein